MFHVEQFRLPQLCNTIPTAGHQQKNPAEPASADTDSSASAAIAHYPSSEAVQTFEQYYALLTRWNSTYNLTSISDPEDFTQLHILDSLAALELIPHGAHICDIGAGAGFPGLPLRIARPDISLDLIESRGKKIQFLKECAHALNLENVRPFHSRMEDFKPASKYERIVSRATFSNDNWIFSVQHWLSQNGAILLWRSLEPQKTGFSDASKSASNREPAPHADFFQKLNWSVRRHYYKISTLAYRVIEEWRPLETRATE